MKNIIQVLPDSVANQIAAGEVVQRPASVVKELVENAIDAGATQIKVIVREEKKTFIQVIDNGGGMSEVDVRLAFERHATSKIVSVNDLYELHTFGFRGEALASIASVAEVEVKTRLAGEDLGTYLLIRGSTVEAQEAIACPEGTSIAVKNLFFNVPARRKFLKSDNVEFRFVETELRRVALCHPEVGLTFYDGDKKNWELPVSNLKQRIVNVFGVSKPIKKGLLELENNTELLNIKGFVCVPELANKEKDKQYFFVNGRYFQSAYFRSAVTRAYEQLLPMGGDPAFFIYLTIDAARLDVNIHPTKTEIKFENEQAVWQFLHAAVRAALGKYALAPTIDFEGAEVINIPVLRPDTPIVAPSITVNPNYNPFAAQVDRNSPRPRKTDWRESFKALPTDESHPFFSQAQPQEVIIPSKLNFDKPGQPKTPPAPTEFIQVKGKYILAAVPAGVMLIDQVRAHRRVLYEQLLQNMQNNSNAQQELFPQSITLDAGDYRLLLSVADDLRSMGLDLSDFGSNTVVVQAIPAFATDKSSQTIVEELLDVLRSEQKTIQQDQQHRLAAALAATAAISAGRVLTPVEILDLLTQLFACANPDVCPQGKPTTQIIGIEELDKKMGK